jgi:hypothetical protein
LASLPKDAAAAREQWTRASWQITASAQADWGHAKRMPTPLRAILMAVKKSERRI